MEKLSGNSVAPFNIISSMIQGSSASIFLHFIGTDLLHSSTFYRNGLNAIKHVLLFYLLPAYLPTYLGRYVRILSEYFCETR